MTQTLSASPEQEARRRRTVLWVVGLATVGLVFDGYDLVVYGTVVSTLLRDPTQIGVVTPALAGALGSYALVGVLVGALLAGSVGDIIGRRKVMLFAYAWFSVGMALTALMTSAGTFGLLRFVTGLGVGALVATTGAIVSEFAPPGKKNLCNAITYCGVPLGSLLAALLAIILLGAIGWRGMFWIGALPLVTLLPLAFFKMPESPAWLLSRGRVDEARALSEKTGVPLSETPPRRALSPARSASGSGSPGCSAPSTWWPTVLLGLMSAMGLLLVYSLNTWLPELMLRAGYNAKGSLSFLLVLNGGAVIGALIGSRVADRFGPKPVVASCFLLGAIAIALLTISLPLGPAADLRRRGGPRHERHPDADLRLRGQLLPDQRARRGRGLVRRVRAARRGRRPGDRRPADRCGPEHERDLLGAGRAGRGRDAPHPGGPGGAPRAAQHPHRTVGHRRTREARGIPCTSEC